MSDIRNLLRSGYDAFYAAYPTGLFGANHRPRWTSNPYGTNPSKDLWLRGWREAEKAYNNRGQFLQPSPFETVPGLRDAACYHEAKARGKAQKRPATVSPVFAAPFGKAQVKGASTGRVVNQKANFKNVDKKPAVVNLGKLDRFAKKHRTVA